LPIDYIPLPFTVVGFFYPKIWIMKYFRLLLFTMLTITFASCSSDDPATVPDNTPPPESRELTIPETGFVSPETYDGMQLVWQDEFEGTSLNEDDWNFETGTGNNGWGNQELQYYREENTSIVEGNLVIEAKKESFSGSEYTSSRITTQFNQSFKYGRIDIRAVLPEGIGMWPALWMLGSNFTAVGWPKCGEIDIMEMFGAQGSNKVLGTVHWDNAGSYAQFGGSTTLSSGIFNDEYHVFSIIWDEELIRWLVDDVQYHAIDITPADLEEFQEEFFFIFNLAVGGDKGAGIPSGGTFFPQWMIVDYVRVFQSN
jgi:beta-glucanase (GH16 family)